MRVSQDLPTPTAASVKKAIVCEGRKRGDNRQLHKTQCLIDQDKCRNCKSCVRTGCPALISTKDKVVIDTTSCTGCTVCKQVCPFDAISEVTK